ncbi:MAG: hypothetical protein NWE84_05105 [Candidatus Bathyarchaeota archaeon]|nr:hypothetical protein [Candidatus Bathyarchaeota archaeon]
MNQWWTKERAGLIGLAALLAIEASVIYLLVCVLPGIQQDILRLPLIVLFGVIAFLGALTIAASVLNFFKLADARQALGLPQGSVRALIALSLILIFALMVIFMANNLMLTEREDFPANSTVVYGGETYTNENGSIIILVGPSQAAIDFSMQVLTTVSTLVVALAGFYFGTRSAEKQVQEFWEEMPGLPSPSLSISPDSPTTLDVKARADANLSITATPSPEDARVSCSVTNDDNATVVRSAENPNKFTYTPSQAVKAAATNTVVTLRFFLDNYRNVAKELEVTVKTQ